MSQCPCGSNLQYESCCGQYHQNEKKAPTPEALMRSRYTAYTRSNIAYIKKTMQGRALFDFDEGQAHQWSKSVLWLGLQIMNTRQDNESCGFVEFKAFFLDKNWLKVIHEDSEFQCREGHWYYIGGQQKSILPQKISRNAPCPCGSHKKFKHCHGMNIAF